MQYTRRQLQNIPEVAASTVLNPAGCLWVVCLSKFCVSDRQHQQRKCTTLHGNAASALLNSMYILGCVRHQQYEHVYKSIYNTCTHPWIVLCKCAHIHTFEDSNTLCSTVTLMLRTHFSRHNQSQTSGSTQSAASRF